MDMCPFTGRRESGGGGGGAVVIAAAAAARQTADRHRKWLVVFGGLSTFLFVGAFFGYGPMQLLLERNGHFAAQCSSAADGSATLSEGSEDPSTANAVAVVVVVCAQQTTALLRIQFVALLTSVASPLLGCFADRYGAPAIGFLLIYFILSGLILLLLAAKYLIDELLYAAFLFLALGTWTGSISIIQLGRLYFTGQEQSRVIFGLNALFDSAAVTYLGIWALAKWTNATLTTVSGTYLGVALVVFGGSAHLWIIVTPSEDDHPSGDGNGVQEVPDHGETFERERSVSSLQMEEPKQHYVLVAERPPRQQLLSRPVLMLALFFGVHVTVNNWTLTTTRDFLGHLGDDAVNNQYLAIFTLSAPVSLLAVPFVDIILARYGFSVGLQFVNGLALLYMTVRVASENLNVQVLGFVLFSFYRCFLFGVVFSFLPTLVAGNVIGKVSGWMYLIAGVTAFLNIPMTKVAVEKFDGDFFVPNLVYLCLYLPCIVFAWDIGRTITRENRIKARLHDGSH